MIVTQGYRPALVAGLLLFLAACGGPPTPPPPYLEFTGATMGTNYTVRISSPEATALDAAGQQALAEAIQAELDLVNAQMSTWRDDSDLSRFNQHDGTDWFPVAPETAFVMAAAQRAAEESDGAFDMTVGPLVNAWGFGPQRATTTPLDEEIEAFLDRVGFGKVAVDEDRNAVRKDSPAVYCDLSGIAKGYGTDRVADMLDTQGYDYMVEVGGEIRTRGVNHRGEVWRIGIVNPGTDGRPTRGVVRADNTAMATSGDYRNYREGPDGRRFSHTIDPRTGRPVDHGLASVTVLHPSAMVADAYATVLMVLGPEAGYDWAVERDLAVHFIVHGEGDDFSSRSTPAFEAQYE